MKLMWLPILEAVMKYLESLPELSSYQVGPVGGAKSPTGTSGQAGVAGKSIIEVDWDSETDAEEKRTQVTNLSVYLNIKYKTDSTDIMASYREMYRVQNAILAHLRVLLDYLLKNHRIAANIDGAGVAPFGSTVRPYLGNQMVLLFEWRKE